MTKNTGTKNFSLKTRKKEKNQNDLKKTNDLRIKFGLQRKAKRNSKILQRLTLLVLHYSRITDI